LIRKIIKMRLSPKESVWSYIDSHADEATNLMKKLIPFKSLGPLNGGPGEIKTARFILNFLKQIGMDAVENYPAPDPAAEGGERPNIIGRIPGKDRSRTVWIMSHMDVVPEGDVSKWDTDPFEAVVKDGKIFGRGTEDNHQGLVSSLMLAKALMKTKVEPAINIALVFMADEETGSIFGAQYLMDNHRDLFSKNDLFIIPDAGEPDGSMIEVAEKSILWFKFVTKGKQVHASLPAKGNNAYRAASYLVVALDRLHQIFDASDDVFDVPECTFEPTKKEANVPNVNTIPGEDVFYLDCRILPQYSIEKVTEEVEKICKEIEDKFKVSISFDFAQKEQAAPATSVNAPIVLALKKAIHNVLHIEAQAQGIGGGTVAAIIRRAGFDAAVWSTIDDLAHQPNEYCVLINLLNDAKVFADVCLQDGK